MNSKQIKAEFKKLGIPVAVRTIPSVKADKWVEARIRPQVLPGRELFFSSHFEQALRRKALAVVYGADFAIKSPAAAAGNIGAHSITLFESQWSQLFDPNIVFPFDKPAN